MQRRARDARIAGARRACVAPCAVALPRPIGEDSSGGIRGTIPGAAALIQLRAGAASRAKGPPRSVVVCIRRPSCGAIAFVRWRGYVDAAYRQHPMAVRLASGLFIPGLAWLDSSTYHELLLFPAT